MKRLGLLFIFTIISLSYFIAQEGVSKSPRVQFKTNVHDFGKIAEEVGQVTCAFEFTNTGSAPLVINSVRTSCGCTTPSYTKEPILPGQKGEIKVAYNTVNRVGSFNKTIRVFSNVPDSTFVLTIKGEVLPRK